MLRVVFALCAVASFVAACAGHWDKQGPHPYGGSNPAAVPLADESAALPAAAPVAAEPTPAAATPPPDTAYRVNPEDKVKITVAGEADLSAEILVDKSGVITGPYVGPIQVQGKTLAEVERAYATRLREVEIMRDPRVKAEVASYRPIYVLGQVKRPGRYAFVAGMTVRAAVALAEGYTTMGSERTVEITRGGAKLTLKVTPDTQVQPGDEIRVPGMIF